MDQPMVEALAGVVGFPLAVVLLTSHVKAAVRAIATGSYWHSTPGCSLWPLVADGIGVLLAIAYWYGGLAGQLLAQVDVEEPNVLTMALLGLGASLLVQRTRDALKQEEPRPLGP